MLGRMTATMGLWVVLVIALAELVGAYIPAVPTNNISLPVFNTSTQSSVLLRWQQHDHQAMGVYSVGISYQLAGLGSDGVTAGAIVHFTEANATNNYTSGTPWIAFINCDANDTDASMETDIFTMAQERGAVSALLYSQSSQACLINAEYLSPDFDKLVDVFATTSSKTAGLIEAQFSQVNASYYFFDAALLNSSAEMVKDSVAGVSDGSAGGYLVAQLSASNATGNGTSSSGGGSSSSSSGGAGSGPVNTGLAMIILYAITGCVSLLFCVVILSGAVRAIRHPERYGPRRDLTYMGGPAAQTRTGGIGRAILDTFPVIKFGSDGAGSATAGTEMGLKFRGAGDAEGATITDGEQGLESKPSRSSLGDSHAESSHSPIQPHSFSPPDPSILADPAAAPALSLARTLSPSHPTPSPTIPQHPTSHPNLIPNQPQPSTSAVRDDEDDDARQRDMIGHETCPICIVDFEPGDDLRVLPCEGAHRFHKDCVDPWLLELSSSCPICRQDLQALDDLISGSRPASPGADDWQSPPAATAMSIERPMQRRRLSSANRISRLLHFRRPPPSERSPSGGLGPGTRAGPVADMETLPPHPLA